MLGTASRALLRQARSLRSPAAHYAAEELVGGSGSTGGAFSIGLSRSTSTSTIFRPRQRRHSTVDHRSALRFHVEPGATLSIDSGPGTKVEVMVGELHDAIEASWESAGGGPTSPSPSSPVEARQVDDRVSLRVSASSSPPVSLLSVRVPSRYCSLRATTRGGDLSVEAIREASLEVSTSPGGAVSLGTVRATVAKIVTGGKGGSVSARELVADCLSVSTESGSGGGGKNEDESDGGDVSVERLVARRGRVSTGGGELRVRSAFYGEALDLDSGGGDVSLLGLTPRASEGGDGDGVDSPSSPPLATVRSRGGSLSVEGIEGDADVDSGGGELSLHLLRGARAVRARSGGGGAGVAVAPDLLSSGGVTAGDGVVLISSSSAGRTKDVSSAADEAEASLEARWGRKDGTTSPSPGSSPLTPASAASASTAGRRGGGDRVRDHGPPPPTVVLVDARPGGRVSVVEESWADAVARRARAAMEGKKG